MNTNNGDIIFVGEMADTIWERLTEYPELLEDSIEIEENVDGNYSDETNARLMTLFQVMAFGDNRIHAQRGGKLERNRQLVAINSRIIRLAIETVSQMLILESPRFGTQEIDLGFASGGTVIYPLNAAGAELYLKNELPPHGFEKEHLVHDSSFRRADAVFVGGMIDAASISKMLNPKIDFVVETAPKLLSGLIGSQVVEFLPPVSIERNYLHGVHLSVEKGYQLPVIATAFSGKGHGEKLAQMIGFVADKHWKDHVSKDRRYLIDLNELTSDRLDLEVKKRLLRGWAWFLSGSPDREVEAGALFQAALELKEHE